MGTDAASTDKHLPPGEPSDRLQIIRSSLDHQANQMAHTRQDPARITTALNEVYSRHSSRLPNAWQQSQARLIGDPRW